MPHSTYVSVHECAREHTCRQEPEFLRHHQLSGFETVSLSGPELTKFASNTQRSSSARGGLCNHTATGTPTSTSVLHFLLKLRSSCLCGKHFTN